MAATSTSALCTGLDEAIAIAREQGVTKLHLVLNVEDPHAQWVAVAQRYRGAQAATDRGDTFEDATVRALMGVGVSW